MANLLIPRREIWTQQPQGSIDIDRGNPITQSLKFAFLGGEYVESVSKKQATVTGFTKKPTAAGMGYVQTGTGSVAYAISPLTGGACTLVSKFYFKPSASIYTECVAQILSTGDTSRVGLYANIDQIGNIASGSIALLVRINSLNTIRAAISSVSEGWHTVVAVWGGGSTISMWLDEKPATVTHSNVGTVSSFFAAGQVVRTFGNGAHDNPVVFGAGINRAVSEAEARSLSANPYQIFAPKVRQLFVPVSAGAATVSPPLHSNGQTFYAPVVSSTYGISPSLHTNSATFYAPVVSSTYGISPSLHTNSATFYAPTVSQSGALQSLSATLHNNASSFFAPSVLVGSVTLTPALFNNSQTYYSHVLNQAGGQQSIAPSLLTNGQAFYSPTVAPGAVAVVPSLYSNTQAFYNLTLTTSKTLTAALHTNSSAFYSPLVSLGGAPLVVDPALFSNLSSFFSHTVTPGAVSLYPLRLDNTQSFYLPSVGSVVSGLTLTPSDISAIAAAVLAALNATTIPVDMQKTNGVEIVGDGTSGDKFRSVLYVG